MKDFENWSKEKQHLEKRKNENLTCKRRQIWLCKIGENLGGESSKDKPFVRPALILHGNFGWDLVLILPMTTKHRKELRHFLFKIDAEGLDSISYAMLNQIRVISKKRLFKKITDSINENDFKNLLKKLYQLIKDPKGQ